MPTPTVFGSPMTKAQKACAELLLSVCKQNKAVTIVQQAIICAAMFETDLGTNLNQSRVGPLSGSASYFPGSTSSPTLWQAEAQAFLNGGKGFRSAIANASSFNDPAKLAAYVEQPDVSVGVLGGSGYGQYFSQTQNGKTGQALMNQVIGESAIIVQMMGAGGITNSTAGVSTKSSTTYPFYIGGPANPNEDVWTGINRLAQERYWYLFSDGETLYLADGDNIMRQPPVASIDRWGDLDRILHLDFTWDNTAWQYTTTHRRRKKAIRKTQLAKITSPVEAQLQYICNIDDIRAGDVIELSGCGPGDGKWLVGDCRRSIFQVYSELTLVPAIKSLTEAQVEYGLGALSNTDVPGAAAAAPGSQTILRSMINAAWDIAGASNDKTPYVYYGGHQQAGTIDIGKPGGPGYNGTTKGFDAAGAVCAILSAGALWPNPTVPDPQQIISTLLGTGTLLSGEGSGPVEVTIFISPSQFFMRIDGKYWGTSDGTPIPVGGGQTSVTQTLPELGGFPGKTPPKTLTITQKLNNLVKYTNQTGGSWLRPPPTLNGLKAYHVAPNLLGDLMNNAAIAAPGTQGFYVNPFQGTSVTPQRIDQGVDYDLGVGAAIGAIGDATIDLVYSFVGSGASGPSGWPGGGYVSYTLSSGPYAGKQIYVAEDIDPVVSKGQQVTAGEKIATFKGGSEGLETGWWSGIGTESLANKLGQAAVTTASGMSFNRFLVSLGVVSGIQKNSPSGTMPAGYP